MKFPAPEEERIRLMEAALREQQVETALSQWKLLWDDGCRDQYRWMTVFNLFDRHNLTALVYPRFLLVALEVGVENDWMLALLARAACMAGAHEVAIELSTQAMRRNSSGDMKFLLSKYLYASNVALNRFEAAISIFLECFVWRPLASSTDLPIQFHEVGQLCDDYGRPDWSVWFRRYQVPPELDRIDGAAMVSVTSALNDVTIRHVIQGSEQHFRLPESINQTYPVESHFSLFRRPEVKLFELNDATILGQRGSFVILSRRGDLIAPLSNAFVNQRACVGIMGLLAELERDSRIIEVNTLAVIRDKFHMPNICHFIYDQISRLALLEEAGINFRDISIVASDMGARFQSEILEILEVPENHFLPTEGLWAYRCERLYIPENSIHVTHPAHLGDEWALEFLRRKLLNDVTACSEPARRLYISRERASGRRIRNSTELSILLEKFGFETVFPETLSFRGQVELFAGASHVLSPHGAGLTNILFCQPGTKILEIFHPFYATGAYFYIAQSLGFDYRIACDATADPATYSPGRGYGYLDIMAPLAQIESWLEEVT